MSSLFSRSTSAPIRLIIQAARYMELLDWFSIRQSGRIVGSWANAEDEALNLALEAADILDELKILMLLFETQAGVLSDLQRECSPVKSREKQQNSELSQAVHDQRLASESTTNAGSLQTLGDINLKETPLLLEGYAGFLVEQAAARLLTQKAEAEQLRCEVIQTRELVSCRGLEDEMVRADAHNVTHRSCSCWTYSKRQPVSEKPA